MLYLVDLDEVVADFLTPVCELHNLKTGSNLTRDDITTWDLAGFGIDAKTWQKPGVFRRLEPLSGSVEALRLLYKQGHRLWIITDAMNIEFIQDEKSEWVGEHIPFVNGVIFTDQKHLIPGDALIDDSPLHLSQYPGVTVKINRPYNRDIISDYNYNTLMEFVLDKESI